MIVNVDSALVEEAMKKSGLASADEAVREALLTYVGRRPVPGGLKSSQKGIVDLFGTVDFDPEWDYKAARVRDSQRNPEDNDE